MPNSSTFATSSPTSPLLQSLVSKLSTPFYFLFIRPWHPSASSRWECRWDAGGRYYYADHKTKTTSWIHPALRDKTFTPDLPYPYEKCVDSSGRIIYKNHETRTISFSSPYDLTSTEPDPAHKLPPYEKHWAVVAAAPAPAHQQQQQTPPARRKSSTASTLIAATPATRTDSLPIEAVASPSSTTTTTTPPVASQTRDIAYLYHKVYWTNPSRNEAELPMRYEPRLDDQGRIYFFDHEDESITWLNPVIVETMEQGEHEPELEQEPEPESERSGSASSSQARERQKKNKKDKRNRKIPFGGRRGQLRVTYWTYEEAPRRYVVDYRSGEVMEPCPRRK